MAETLISLHTVASLLQIPTGHARRLQTCSRISKRNSSQITGKRHLTTSGNGSVFLAPSGKSLSSLRRGLFEKDLKPLASGFITLVGKDGIADTATDSENPSCEIDDVTALKAVLNEANARAEAAEKEKMKALDELSRKELKLKEYTSNMTSSTALAVSELEAAKSSFHEQLQKLVDEKLAMQSQLLLARQDALDLAVQVEKIAETAIEEATAHIVEEAKLRISAAETSAAEVTLEAEKQLTNVTDSATLNLIKDLKGAFDKALHIAQAAREEANKAQQAFKEQMNMLDELVNSESTKISLQKTVNDLERQVKITQNEVKKLQAELKAAEARYTAAEARAVASEKALQELQEHSNKAALAQEESTKKALEDFKKAVAEREEASAIAFRHELESLQSAIDAFKKAESVKEEAYIRRFMALERALVSAESTANAWKKRSQTAESLLQKTGEDREDAYVLNGGRMEFLIKDDTKRLKLLAKGPRRETPEWMARRIDFVRPKFPPLKSMPPEGDIESALPLELPKPEEVWSIAEQRPRVDDAFTKQAVEAEVIKKKRKALEQVLERKVIQKKRVPEETKLEPGTGTGREIVFQAFNWESWRRRWYLELAPRAADLSQSGITAVWLPPPTESVAPQGYMPLDYYNLNSSYGTQEELKQCIDELHKYDLLALGDVVLNHRCAHKQSPNGIWNIFGGKLAWGPEAIVRDDPNFQGRGNPSSGDIFHAAPNIDHSQDFVRKDIKDWLNWLRTEVGFDGWRLDFVRGFWGGYVKEYIDASNPAFAIGEYWDSMAYEGGNLCYNQDAHRQRIINWINATGGTSSAFDVTTKGILHSALHGQYWRLIDPRGKPTGVMGWWPSRAVTFLENHDTGSTQGHWPFPRDKLIQGYAYIITHPGTPSIFYDHFYDFGLHDSITELIEARTRAGIHCRSAVKIFNANNDGYVAQIGDNLVMKLGQFDWNPSKQDNLTGSWQTFLDRGIDYKIWLRK